MSRKKIRKVKPMPLKSRLALFSLLVLVTTTGCGGGSGGGGSHPSETQDYSLGGTVIPAGNMVTDSDVNDPFAAYESNDQFYQAQELSAPVRVSGYVNQAGEGPSGRSYSQGDPEDIFVADLTGGTRISLYMAEDPASADLSLYLYDDGENLVDASLTEGEAVDSVSVPADGVYYIGVEATESAAIYVLTVGDIGGQTAIFPLRISDDFVPGEVIVQFDEKAEASAVSSLSASSGGVSSIGLYTKAGAGGRNRLLKRAGIKDTPIFFSRLGVQEGLSRSLSRGKLNGAAAEKMETIWMIRALKKMQGVQYAEPNYIRRALATEPNDPGYYRQWHYPLINLPEAWDITTGSSDVIVAVVDTGVLSAHPDLDEHLVAGYDFVDGDADPEDEDDFFHGTHVAGTVAAESNNSQGGAGVAWNAWIMPLRVLDETGEGSNWDIIQAVRYAAGLSNDSGTTPSTPADIINMSLGGESPSQYEMSVYEAVREQGVIVIAAAGSDGTNTKMYPAAYEGVVSVGAVTSDGEYASYSNYGVFVDVAAPGGGWNSIGDWNGVYSTIGEWDIDSRLLYTYGELAGTSMATPHVSGVAALMKSLYPGLAPLEFDALLQGGYLTQDGSLDWNLYRGYGLIDAEKSVQIVKEAQTLGELRPLLHAIPGRLDFSTLGSLLYVTVTHAGGGSLSVTDFYGDASWLSVTGETGVVDQVNGLEYTVEVSRDGLSNGVYTGSITFETSGDPLVVWVRMEVGEISGTLDGGFHYITLVDPDTDEAVEIAASGGENGVYPYEFTDLAYGDSFVIAAGTDPDNDGYICEDGEICGRYPVVDDPLEIEVTRSRSELDFYSEIQSGLSSAGSAQAGKMAIPLQRDDYGAILK